MHCSTILLYYPFSNSIGQISLLFLFLLEIPNIHFRISNSEIPLCHVKMNAVQQYVHIVRFIMLQIFSYIKTGIFCFFIINFCLRETQQFRCMKKTIRNLKSNARRVYVPFINYCYFLRNEIVNITHFINQESSLKIQRMK